MIEKRNLNERLFYCFKTMLSSKLENQLASAEATCARSPNDLFQIWRVTFPANNSLKQHLKQGYFILIS